MNAETKELAQLVLQLMNVDQRESTLFELSKKRETFADLAPVLWYSFGTIAILLQEIISIYPMLSPPTLTPQASNRVCNALALIQCVASHTETKSKLVNAHIPLYLYPFLNTTSRLRPFEYLRLTSLGVIGALVKVDDGEVVNFLLQTEIIPLCLRIMETGSDLSKTVATFIVQKILLDESGLKYICATAERFYSVSTVLSSMVTKLVEAPSIRLLKHLVRCYLRLSENTRAREALRDCLPEALKGQAFAETLRSEEAVQRWLTTLLKNISDGNSQPVTTAQSIDDSIADQSQSLSFMTSATASLSINDKNRTNDPVSFANESIGQGSPIWMNDEENDLEPINPLRLDAAQGRKEEMSLKKRVIYWSFRLLAILLSILMAITASIGLSSVNGVDSTKKVFVAVYMFFFALVLFIFELNQLKPIEVVDHMFKRNFGFLFSVAGHALFLIFIAFLSFGLGEPQALSFITGSLLAAFGIAKFCLYLQYPELIE